MVLLRFIPVADISLFFFFFYLFSDHAPLHGYTIISPFTSSWRTLGFFPFCGCFKECWNIQLSCGFVSFFFPLIQSVFALCVLKFCYYVIHISDCALCELILSSLWNVPVYSWESISCFEDDLFHINVNNPAFLKLVLSWHIFSVLTSLHISVFPLAPRPWPLSLNSLWFLDDIWVPSPCSTPWKLPPGCYLEQSKDWTLLSSLRGPSYPVFESPSFLYFFQCCSIL